MSGGREGAVGESGDPVLALSAEHMVKLTGLTMRQLAYWDATGFFKPEYAAEGRRSPHSRVYSFRDAVGLRTISVLLGRHGVALPHLKDVARSLSAYTDRPWSDLKLMVWNRRVQFDEPETGQTRDVVHGQYVLLPIIEVIQEVEAGVARLKDRDQATIGRFEKHRNVAHNRLVLAGTRIPVATILEYVEDGYSVADIMGEFPSLTEADVLAVMRGGKAALVA